MSATSFIGLWSTKPIDACIISPEFSDLGRFKELEGLDGVEASRYTSGDDMKFLFRTAKRIAGARMYRKIVHVADSELLPRT